MSLQTAPQSVPVKKLQHGRVHWKSCSIAFAGVANVPTTPPTMQHFAHVCLHLLGNKFFFYFCSLKMAYWVWPKTKEGTSKPFEIHVCIYIYYKIDILFKICSISLGEKYPIFKDHHFSQARWALHPLAADPCCWPLPLSSPASQRPGPAKLRSSGHRCYKCYGPCRSNESLSGQRLGKAWCVGWLVGLGWASLVGWLVSPLSLMNIVFGNGAIPLERFWRPFWSFCNKPWLQKGFATGPVDFNEQHVFSKMPLHRIFVRHQSGSLNPQSTTTIQWLYIQDTSIK